MTLQIEVSIEHLRTQMACESLDSSMNLDMFVKIRSLSETEAALGIFTDIGPLVCVNAQMIEEIVPFPEPFVAVLVVALQDFYQSLRLRVFISEDSELFCVGNMLFDLYRSKIKCLSSLNSDSNVRAYIIESIASLSQSLSPDSIFTPSILWFL